MNIIEPGFEVIEEQDILKKIELAGRVAYKSEDKITKDSNIKFVKKIIKRGHESVLEHGVIYTESDRECPYDSPYLKKAYSLETKTYYTGGNVRAWRDVLESHPSFTEYDRVMKEAYPVLFDDAPAISTSEIVTVIDFKDIPNDIKCDLRYTTVRLTCDRGVSHELVRHRKNIAFTQESTRYVNYAIITPDDAGINVIMPKCFSSARDEFYSSEGFEIWQNTMEVSEVAYERLIAIGYSPQEARAVLPLSTKTEVIMSCFHDEWHSFFKKRLPKGVHPHMRELMIPLYKLFVKNGWFEDADLKHLYEGKIPMKPTSIQAKSPKIVVLNGSGGSGKDTFFGFFKEELEKIEGQAIKFSTIDPIKDILSGLGITEKNNKNRKLMSDMKEALTEHSDYSLEYIRKCVANSLGYDYIFVDCREPLEIAKLVKEFDATTVLIKRGGIEQFDNMADRNVEDYAYDWEIVNYSLERLRKSARTLINVWGNPFSYCSSDEENCPF